MLIGTALTGTLVSHMYTRRVGDALQSAGAAQWFGRMRDPQVLVNREAQQSLVLQLVHAGHDGSALIEAAREALVASIHAGIAVAMVVAVFAIWQCRRVPQVRIRRAPEPAVVSE